MPTAKILFIEKLNQDFIMDQLFDLNKDPDENTNIAEQNPDQVNLERRALEKNCFLDNSLNLVNLPSKDNETRIYGIMETTGQFVNLKPFLSSEGKINILEGSRQLVFNFLNEVDAHFSVDVEPSDAEVKIGLYKNGKTISNKNIFLGVKGENPKEAEFSFFRDSPNICVPLTKTPYLYNVAIAEMQPGCYLYWLQKKETDLNTLSKEQIEDLRALGYID